MPVMDGIELIRQIKKISPESHILVLSCHDDFTNVKEAMKLGIDDYILKNDLTENNLLEILNKMKELKNDFEEEETAISDKINAERNFLKNFDEGGKPEELTKFLKDNNLLFKFFSGLIIIPNDSNSREENFLKAFEEMIGNVCKNIIGEKIKTYFFSSNDEIFLHWGSLLLVLSFYKLDKEYPEIMNELARREARGEM